MINNDFSDIFFYPFPFGTFKILFLSNFEEIFMSYFDVLGSIFEIWAITDLPNIIVSMCLVSHNICMIPHVCKVTFGLNLSGAWGVDPESAIIKVFVLAFLSSQVVMYISMVCCDGVR